MEILGFALLAIGVIIGLIYGIILLVKAFQTSVWWGLGYLLLSFPVGLIFIIKYWDETKKPFLMSLLSIPFMVGGVLLIGPALEQPAA